MSKNRIEKFFGGIILLFIIIVMEIISLIGINVINILDNLPFMIGVAISILIIEHFIPEKVYDYYEDHPALFYIIYFLEFVILLVLLIGCHNKYYQ